MKRLEFGELNILVNNAGIAPFEPFLEHTEATWDRTLAKNLKSVFLLGQGAARLMVSQGKGGSIVNMASINGHVGEKELPVGREDQVEATHLSAHAAGRDFVSRPPDVARSENAELPVVGFGCA